MLKKLIVLLLILAPIGLFAQEKIAYINTDELFKQMPEMADIQTKITAKQTEIKTTLDAIQAETDKKVAEWDAADKAAGKEPSQADLAGRQKEFDSFRERYQTYSENSEKVLQETYTQLLTPVREKLLKAIKDVGTENKFSYIIEVGAAPYISPTSVDAGKLVKTKLGIK